MLLEALIGPGGDLELRLVRLVGLGAAEDELPPGGAAASGWLKGLVAPDAVENGGGSTDGELLERLSFGAGSSTRG